MTSQRMLHELRSFSWVDGQPRYLIPAMRQAAAALETFLEAGELLKAAEKAAKGPGLLCSPAFKGMLAAMDEAMTVAEGKAHGDS